MKKIILYILFMTPQILFSQIEIGSQPESGKISFPVYDGTRVCDIYYDPQDDELVKKISAIFVQDIERVTDKTGNLVTDEKQMNGNVVFIGTINRNRIIDKLIDSKQLDVTPILSQWERYIVKALDNPFPGVNKALVIAGSDRRGTAYGVFSISDAMGISPWYWWADVPVLKSRSVFLKNDDYISKAPSVKYRGIFINDEDWGMKPWASKLMDPSLNDIGPRTYAKVCELLLRLKANYLWPAMHECTGAFNKYEENKLVADSFGIVMGSAHCEPLLFNNATEWDTKTMGEWNYKTNKAGILAQLEKRVKSNAPFENVYTLGLRGLHDAGMIGDFTQQEKVINLQNAIQDQRNILKKHIDAPIESVPQVLIPYKEVMELYEKGVQVPDDVTLVWPDDNYGYIKRLSTPEEQKRSGRFGVYYHVSYLGEPHNYLWMSTTPPALIYGEMSKAYRTGADRLWVVNVGDIKGCEYSTNLFLDMAWNIEQYNYETVHKHPAQWYARMFGSRYLDDFQEIWDTFYHLAFIRKPEYMGWGFEWNSRQAGTEVLVDTDFSFFYYREAEKRLKSYEQLVDKTTQILAEIDRDLKPSFFQLVYYPVKAAALMNKKMLTAQKNRLYAEQGRAKTKTLADSTKLYFDRLQELTDHYNSMLDGKWNGMMSLKQGWFSSVHKMPPVERIKLKNEPIFGIYVEGDEPDKYCPKPFAALPAFNSYAPETYYIDVVNKGGQILNWSAVPSEDWVILSQSSGETKDEQRIFVSVDWEKRPVGEYVFGEILFISGNKNEKVFISTFKPANVKKEDLKGLFVEQNGYISIPAADFHRKRDNREVELIVIDGLGIENKSIQFGDPLKRLLNPRASIDIDVEYDFYVFQSGTVKVYTYALPVFPLNPLEKASYALTVDKGLVFKPDIAAGEYSDTWKQNVLRNYTVSKSELYLPAPGKHTLKISGITQGMVIQKIVIDTGGLKDSYTGPESTFVE
ncbi:glycosyl hydrolase 115 family protein [candidate division KSB1 bacterium]|nr:glycosyl hydrolase 115 family protein [candidate division KSB1 bacterium]